MRDARRIRWARTAIGTTLFLAGLLIAPLAGATGETTYSGRATGVFVHTSLGDLRFSDTGELPPEGGTIDATLVAVDTSLATAEVLLSVTMGFDGTAQSEAAVADVSLLPGNANGVTADFVRARSSATCTGVAGESELANVRVGGEPITVSGRPNQVLTVPGVFTLIINEQIDASHGGTYDMTVNALHLFLFTGDQVIVSHAHSDITCGSEAPRPKDFVTGGGWIPTGEAKANLGFVAGYKSGETDLSGNFNFMDHGSKMHVKSVSIETYGGEGIWREFSGPATIDGVGGYRFDAYVEDNGEPGHGDFFRVTLSTGYRAEGYLAGGNIQIHA